MTKVIAAIDNSAAARPVLAVAKALAHVLDSSTEAVHVRQDGEDTLRAEAEGAGVPLRSATGSVAQSILHAALEPDVTGLVMGMRRTPGGARPVGSVAQHVITSIDRLVVLVPPDCPLPYRLHSVLVPLAGEPSTAASLRSTIRIARAHELEVVVLHVYDEASLPAFEDQRQHENEAWAREFLARYVQLPERSVRLELRVGVPGEEVLTVAREASTDMIAVAWGQVLSPERAQIARSVLGRSTVPTLLLPATFTPLASVGGPAQPRALVT